MRKLYLALRRAASVLIGMVLFLAGSLKLMDPAGAELVMMEYFKFFHLSLPEWTALAAGSLASLSEAVLGAALITGVWRKIVAYISGGVLLAFTILTFILWMVNPAMDCGCFGEAIHLTHAQSLIKNLVLCGLWAIAFIPPKNLPTPKKIKYVTFLIAAISSLTFGIVSFFRLPLIDFTPYKAGEEVKFSVSDINGEYLDSLLLSGDKLVISHYLIPGADELMDDFEFAETATECGFETVILTPGPSGSPEDNSLFFADRKEILTLNRSDGGITRLHNGEIVRKWSVNFPPDSDDLKKLAGEDPLDDMLKYSAYGRLYFEGYLLYVFAVMLLL